MVKWYFSLKVKIKNIAIGFFVLVVIISAILVIKNRNKKAPTVSPLATPSIQEQMKNKFKNLVVPLDTEKIELKDVSGGVGMGIATRTEMVADLPELPSGKYYQGWLENISGKKVLLGVFSMAKGGWILDYNSSSYPGYDKVIVTQGETHILEGSF